VKQTKFRNHEGIAIASGQVLKTGHVHKFGYSPTIGGAFETIWDGGVPYEYIITPSVCAATSSNTSADNGSVILVSGLDVNHVEVFDTVIVGGISGTVLFHRIFRAKMLTATTDHSNVGKITITAESKSVAMIIAGNAQTLMSIYTIPAGKTGYLIQFQGSVEKSQSAKFRLIERGNNGDPFQIKDQWGTFASPITYNYPIPLVISATTDIEIQASAGATMGVGAMFDLVLVDD
jgi:hypothetical protein